MASYEQLSAQQRAIIDLIVKRGQSYGQLAEKLGMPEDRVRELAREALTGLAPVSAAAVDSGWRAQVADYLLGQQQGAEATATRGHLGRSEAARAWSRSVLDSLEHLYPKGELPEIPSGEGGGEAVTAPSKPAASAAKPADRKPSAPLSPEAAAIVRRRRIFAIAGGAALLLALVLFVWPIGLLGGDDASDSAADGDSQGGQQTRLVGQVVLEPRREGSDDAGLALVTRTGDQFELALEARLTPTKRNQAYEVWLFNSRQDAVSLGAQVTDDQGTFAGRAALPEDWESYEFIDISREQVDRNAAHSGTSVLRAAIADIERATEQQQQPQQQQGGNGGGNGAGQ